MKTWKHNEEAQRCSEFNYQRSNAYFESKAFLHGAVNCFDTYRLMNSYESSELRFAFQGHLMQMRLQVQRWNYINCQEDMRNGQMLNSNCCGELPRLAIAFFAAFTACINWPFETHFSATLVKPQTGSIFGERLIFSLSSMFSMLQLLFSHECLTKCLAGSHLALNIACLVHRRKATQTHSSQRPNCMSNRVTRNIANWQTLTLTKPLTADTNDNFPRRHKNMRAKLSRIWSRIRFLFFRRGDRKHVHYQFLRIC